MTKRRVQAGLLLLVGLVLGIFLLIAMFQHGGRASAAPAATCSVNGSGQATVSLISGTPFLTVDNLHELVVDGTTPACGILPGGLVPTISSIVIVVPSGDTPLGVKLDQSSGQLFPCGVPIDATSVALNVEVDAAPAPTPPKPPAPPTPAPPLVAGVNASNVNQVNTAGCGSPNGPNLSINPAATLDLKGSTGPGTLSAGGGGFGFAGPATVTATLDGTTSGAATPDTFVAGNGAETFATASPGSTLDFSSASNGPAGTLTANFSTVTAAGLSSDTAALTNSGFSPLTYNYVTGGSDFTTIKGLSSGQTNVYLPGAATAGAATTDSYNLSGNNVIAHGTADSTFYNVSLAGPGSAPAGSGNQVVGGPGTETFAVTGTGLSLVGGPGTDTFTVTPPSTQTTGANTFIAGPGNDFFYATGTGNTGNTVDFSKVQTSSAAVGQLAINVAGGLEGVGPGGNTALENGQAALGSTVSYTFSSGQGSTDASPFTNFIGANNGNTQFLAGGAGGLTFTGGGSANSASLLTPTGVIVNLSGGTQTPSTNLGPSTPLNGFTVGSGLALVAPPTGVATSCSGTPLPGFCDSLVDVGTVTGPPTIGYSTFYAGPSPGTYNFSDAGDHNTFIGGTGTDVFSSAGNLNTFVPGSGPATFNESGPTQGASNTIDFSNVPVGRAAGCTAPPCSLSVNVSGSPGTVGNYQAAVLSSGGPAVATYNFGNGGGEFTNFIGAAGGLTTFNGGQGPYTYTGQGAGNSLDFSGVSTSVATTLTFDVTHIPNPQATLGGVPETFSGITNLVGLASGNTQFQGGSTGGYTFKGNGSGNQASFSAQGPSTTLTVGVNSAVAGGTVTFSLAGQTTPLCSPVPVTIVTPPPATGPNGNATCLTSNLPVGTDQVLAIYTPPSGSAQSGSGVALTPTVTTGQPAPPATTTHLNLPPSPTYQSQQVSLSATVSSGTPLSAGTVAFSEAGGTALCTASVSAGPTSETVGCPPGFSFPTAGAYDVTAVYTPNGSSVSGSADEQAITVQPPTFYQTSVSIAPGDCSYGNHNFPPPYSGFYPACQATVQVQGGATNLPGGTFTFSTPDGSQICSDTFGDQGSPSKVEACFFPAYSNGEEIIGTYSPNLSSNPAVMVSGSAGLALFSDTTLGGQATNTTSLSSLATSPTAGTRVTLQATVNSSAGALPAGGTMFFKVAGGATLCSVPVPGGLSTATLNCSTSFVGVGYDDVVVAYSPPSSSSVLGSADQKTVQVVQPTSTTVVGTPAQEDAAPGVVVNLSAATVSGILHIGTINNSTPIQVGGGQVLVAAPPAGTSSCSGSPVPSFCDNLVDISQVNGSSQGHNTFVAGSGNETFGDTHTGTPGGDSIDFSNVATSSQTPLTVNATGSPIGLMAIDTATVGGTTYTFNQGGSNFTSFTGATNGNTTFLAGGSANYTFTGAGGNDSIDFSTVGSPVAVDLSKGPFPTTVVPNVTLSTGKDTITGLTTVVGSNGGGNTFSAGPAGATYTLTGNGDSNDFIGGGGPDVFTSNGSDNTFTAGSGNATFNDAGSSNTVDLSALSGTSAVDVSGVQVGATANGTATSGNSTYTFTSFGNAPTTFNGSKGGTTFFAGTVGDTFQGKGTAGDTLSFADTPSNGPLTFTPAACQTGQPPAGLAALGSVTEPFCGIEVFDGLTSGNTTFVTDGTPGFTFNATGTNNAADFSAATQPIVADLYAGTVQVGTSACSGLTNCDALTGITSVLGSDEGGNTFIAGSGSETFGDALSAGRDTINFTHVQTSPTTFLSVNASGGPVNGQANDTAAVGSVVYTFSRGGTGFTTFTGSANGNTNFLAGATPGYTFNGAGNDSIDFSAVHSGATVDLSANPLSGTVSFSGAQRTACLASPGTCDILNSLTTVIGSNGGSNHFFAGDTTGSYVFTGNGNNNSFTGGSGPDQFTSNGNNNTFVAGTGSATFSDPGASNIVDFSAVPGSLTVDVSGVQVGGTANDTASGSAGPYNFTSFGAQPTTFKGSSSGGTTFDAGFAADTFDGNGPTSNPNTLSFAYAPSSGPLVLGPTALDCSSVGQAVLGSVKEPFCGIEDFTGLASGNTTFVPAKTAGGGFLFTATGSNNTADFSANTNAVTANLSNQTAHGVAAGQVEVVAGGCSTVTNCDTVTGVSSVLGSQGGHNTFVAGNGSETFGDTGNVVGGGGDAIDFSAVVTSPSAPLTVNVSGTPVVGVSNDTAGTPSATYNFSNLGSNFTGFTGSGNGFTKFVAPAAIGGYTFSAGPNPLPSDTADFSANLSGITANLSTSTEPVVTGGSSTGVNVAQNQVSVAAGPNTATSQDTISGMTTVIGSPFGANTFYGGLTGTAFTSTASTNTLSYIGLLALKNNGGVRVDLTGDHVTLVCPPSPSSCTGLPTQTDTFAFSASAGLTVQGSPGNDSFLIGTMPVSLSGGGGADTLDLTAIPVSSGTSGATVNLAAPTGGVTGPAIPQPSVSFTNGCGPANDLCVDSVIGSHHDDTVITPSGSPFQPIPTLSSPLPTTSPVTALSVNALSTLVAPGPVTVASGAHTQSFTTTGAAAGATSIPITSATPNFAYPTGSTVTAFSLTLTGNGGNDTLDLSSGPTNSATVTMPTTAAPEGTVTGQSSPSIGFTGLLNVLGTSTGGDGFTVGSGTESFTENGAAGTLDFSKVGTTNAGVTVSVGNVGGVSSGSVTSSPSVGVADTFTNIGTFNGTVGPDTFAQSGPGAYAFNGGAGGNILDLTNAPSDVTVNLAPPSPACVTAGTNNGTAISLPPDNSVNDTFTCMATVLTAGAQTFQAAPGQTSMLNGGGTGTLQLVNDAGTGGVTVTLPNGPNPGMVIGDGYNFKFTGMATVIGTPNNDLFIPGTGNVKLIGGGGDDAISYNGSSVPGPVVANLSNAAYTIPAGFPGAGTTAAPATATGGYGGTIALSSISNIIGTTHFNDILIAGPGPGTLVGGSGNDRFVLSGGDTFVAGGTGSGTTLDMSQLPGQTQLNLGNSSPQNTGAGTVTVQPGTIHTVVASPGGSNLQAGNGNVTLQGGPGNDWLAGGNGTQSLIGGGGNDTLVAGVGNQTLQGGVQPVTFVPGQGNDTLTSQASGNTLDYTNAPNAVQVNLSNVIFPIPQKQGGGFLSGLTATGGSGATVNLSQANVTTVNGSSKADIVVSGSSGDTVNGDGGDDLIVANSGNNFLNACSIVAPNACGSPKTTFAFDGAGNNVIKGGGAATVDFSAAPAGVTVDLQHGTASGGYGGFQSLTGVLNAIGTNFNDTLIAGAPGGTMTGLNGGGDRLQSGSLGGDTLVSGGSANDTFCAASSCAIGGTTAGGGDTMIGGFGSDTFFARNGMVDTIEGGPSQNNAAQVDSFDIVTNIQTFLP